MINVINLEEMPEGIMELGGRIKVLSGKDMTSCMFPEPFDYVEVRGIWRKENEADTKFRGLVLYCLTMLIPGIVEHYGDRGVTRFPSHFFKKGLGLLRIHVHHGMGLYDVQRKRIDAPKEVETVASRSGLEIKRLLAPYMAGERLQREMGGIHEIELASAFFSLIYNRLQCRKPFLLFLRTGFARYGLCLYETEATAVHYLPCPRKADCNSADVPDDVCALGATSWHFGFQSLGNLVHVFFQPAAGRPEIGAISRTESIPLLL